ncbi:MAG TPA: alpha/beta hydrolase [Candidatus Kapabacteria bacterium]|nr:alpha/beta hydrolase [Candidatus Kapabacteria bacterium]
MLVHFAHANGVPAAAYQPIFDRLQPHTVIALPMFGHNPAFPCTHNWRYLADELIDFLQRNAQEPVLGVGHSMGAVVTFIAACKRPELFRGVLMLDPPLMWGRMAMVFKVLKLLGKSDDFTPAGKSKNRKQSWPNRANAIEYFASKRLFQFHPECFESFCNAAIDQSEGDQVKLRFRVDVEVEIFRNTSDNLKSCKRPPQLPMKLVYADRSDASRADMVVPFARHFSIPLEQIPGEHMYPLQQPDVAAELIHQFIRECQP